jgi:hypothetical protein
MTETSKGAKKGNPLIVCTKTPGTFWSAFRESFFAITRVIEELFSPVKSTGEFLSNFSCLASLAAVDLSLK